MYDLSDKYILTVNITDPVTDASETRNYLVSERAVCDDARDFILTGAGIQTIPPFGDKLHVVVVSVLWTVTLILGPVPSILVEAVKKLGDVERQLVSISGKLAAQK